MKIRTLFKTLSILDLKENVSCCALVYMRFVIPYSVNVVQNTVQSAIYKDPLRRFFI